MERYKVLLIDDDSLFLFLTQQSLKKSEAVENIKAIEDINEAKQYLEESSKSDKSFPQLIFMDINMPEMDGIAFARYYEEVFAKKFPDTRLYMLTSSVSKSQIEEALEINSVEDVLEKPLTPDIFRKILT